MPAFVRKLPEGAGGVAPMGHMPLSSTFQAGFSSGPIFVTSCLHRKRLEEAFFPLIRERIRATGSSTGSKVWK